MRCQSLVAHRQVIVVIVSAINRQSLTAGRGTGDKCVFEWENDVWMCIGVGSIPGPTRTATGTIGVAMIFSRGALFPPKS